MSKRKEKLKARQKALQNAQQKTKIMREVVQLYKTLPALWNTKYKGYFINDEKEDAYKKLLEKYRQFDNKATKDDIKRTISSMCGSYRRELHTIKLRKMEGIEYTPKIWYFNEFHFLRMQRTLNDIDTLSIVKVNNSDSECFEAENLQNNSKGEGDEGNSAQNDGDECDEKDEFYYWALACAADMRKMDKTQQPFAKKAISAIIMGGQLGQLHSDSVKITVTKSESQCSPSHDSSMPQHPDYY